MTDKYILNDKGVPVLEPDLYKWGRWFETSRKQRIVKQEMVKGLKVSTVFLGLDHNWLRPKGKPVLWETMVFAEPHYKGVIDQEMDRCSGTHKDALAMHKKMVKRVKKGIK